MDNNIAIICSLVASIAAMGSIYFAKRNLDISKGRMVSDVFPQNRIRWISEVRDLISKFIDLYFEEANLKPADRKGLLKVILKIELFFNYHAYYNRDYHSVKEILYRYLKTNDVITDHTHLIIATQKMFDSVLSRAKSETGITPKIDDNIRQKFQNQHIVCQTDNHNITPQGVIVAVLIIVILTALAVPRLRDASRADGSSGTPKALARFGQSDVSVGGGEGVAVSCKAYGDTAAR